MSEERKTAVKGDGFDFLFAVVLIGLGLFAGLPDFLNWAYPLHRSAEVSRMQLVLPAVGAAGVLIGARFLARWIKSIFRHD